MSLLRFRGSVPQLTALTLDSLTALDTVAAGATLANIGGNSEGATITISPADGRIVVSGDNTKLLRGMTAVTDGPISINLIKTKSGYANSPLSTPFVFTFTSASIPFVAPGAGWNGTAKSGGVPAVFPGGNVTNDPITRTTAKPAILWNVPSNMVLSPAEDLIFGVDADAGGAKCMITASCATSVLTVTAISADTSTVNLAVGFNVVAPGIAAGTTIASLGTGAGGIGTYNLSTTPGTIVSAPMVAYGPSGVKQVDFYVEGTTQTITTPQWLTYSQFGQTFTRYGYFIMLRESDFAAHAGTGAEARIFATAVPNDTTMQNRIIGYDTVSGYDGNYPMSVCPRATANDFAYTVATSNSGVSPNFTTLNAAFTQAIADSAERPLITFTQTGSYEATSMSQHVSGVKPLCIITHSVGIVATLGRAAAYTPNSPSSWAWTPGWDGIEFRGSGIVFQQRNFTATLLGRPSWFNGCQYTNSIGTRDTLYFNNGAQGLVPVGTLTLPCWIDNVYTEFVCNVGRNNYYCQNLQSKELGGDVFTGTYYLFRPYQNNFDNSFFRQPNVNRVSITYTNPGGHTTARISRPGGASITTGQNLTVKVDGSTVATIALGYYSTDTNATAQDLVNAINAAGVSGLAASVLNSGGGWVASGLGFNGSDWSFDTNIFNTTANLNCTPDPHGDYWQWFGNGTYQNQIFRGPILFNDPNEIMWNFPLVDKLQDCIIKGAVTLGSGGVGSANQNFGAGPNAGGGFSHVVIENFVIEGGWNCVDNQGQSDFIYCSVRNGIFNGVFTSGSGGPNYLQNPPFVNCFYFNPAGIDNVAGQGWNVGVFEISAGTHNAATFQALFANYAAINLAPAVAGSMLANLKPTVNVLDGRGLAFATPTSVVGPWDASDPTYTPPF
jgi:hypothetical protein